MGVRSHALRLTDILTSIERILHVLGERPLDEFEMDWESLWLVERGVEIISEASRHLSQDLKSRHPDIPWRKIAGVGNILRHDYESVAAPVLWKLARADLKALQRVCRAEWQALPPEERSE